MIAIPYNKFLTRFSKKIGRMCKKYTYALQFLLLYFHGSHHFVDLRNFEDQGSNCHTNGGVGEHINAVVANGIENGMTYPRGSKRNEFLKICPQNNPCQKVYDKAQKTNKRNAANLAPNAATAEGSRKSEYTESHNVVKQKGSN